MSKLLTLSENSYVRKYTSETEVNSLKITAPKVNLLPYDIYSKCGKPVNINSNLLNEYGTYHFDFTQGLDNLAGRRIFFIDKIFDYVDLKPGTYTICFRIKNIEGSYNLGSLTCYRSYRTLSTGSDAQENIGTMNITPGTPDALYNLVFTIPNGQLTYDFRLGSDFLAWSSTARDLKFDFEFIGLFNGEISIDRQSNTLSDTPEFYVENSNNVLGEYCISTDVLRHIKQIERHLIAHNNEFIIKFR